MRNTLIKLCFLSQKKMNAREMHVIPTFFTFVFSLQFSVHWFRLGNYVIIEFLACLNATSCAVYTEYNNYTSSMSPLVARALAICSLITF